MLRNDVPPPAPAVMPSMSSPASLNMFFCSATAQGSVATRRPYWLTVIFAAQAGVTAKVITAVAGAGGDHMMFPPFTPAVIAEVLVAERLLHLAFPHPPRRPSPPHKKTRGNP